MPCGSAGLPRRAGTTTGRTSTSRCCAPPGESVRVHEACCRPCRSRSASTWRLPDGTWPDGRQSFLTLHPDPGALAEPTRIVDLHVHDDTPEARRIDVRRHGRVLVGPRPRRDRSRRSTTTSATWSAAACSRSTRSPSAATSPAGWCPRGRRSQPAEATALYLRLGLVALVTLLRNEACPWRFDYGLRYLRHRPARRPARPGGGAAARVRAPSPSWRPRCFAWMDELLAAPPSRGSAVDGRVIVGAAVPESYTPADAEPGSRRTTSRPARAVEARSRLACCWSRTPAWRGRAGDWLGTWSARTPPFSWASTGLSWASGRVERARVRVEWAAASIVGRATAGPSTDRRATRRSPAGGQPNVAVARRCSSSTCWSSSR